MTKSLLHALLVLTMALLSLAPLAGCSPATAVPPPAEENTPAPSPTQESAPEVPTPTTEPPVKSVAYPDYYPTEYEAVVEASKAEGALVVYSTMNESNWKPVIEAFNELYPWIEVQTLDLGGAEVFERYYTESATGSQTADLMIAADASAWIEFVKNRGEAIDYESPEGPKLPDWSMPFPGLYTLTTDPMVMLYNEQLLPEDLRPKGLTELAEMASENPEVFAGMITTYDIVVPIAFDINWAYVRDRGEETWPTLETLGPMTLPEQS